MFTKETELFIKKNYDLWLYENLETISIKDGGTVVAEFVEVKSGSPLVKYVLDDWYVKEHHMRQMMVTYNDSIGCYIAFLTYDFARKLRVDYQEMAAMFAMFHEAGHAYFKHLQNKSMTQEDYRNIRNDAIKNGDACEIEKEADAFACIYCGKKYAVKALKQMKNERVMADRLAGNEKKERAILSAKEYDYRIKAIKNIKI